MTESFNLKEIIRSLFLILSNLTISSIKIIYESSDYLQTI